MKDKRKAAKDKKESRLTPEEKGLQAEIKCEEILKQMENGIANFALKNIKQLIESKLSNIEEKPLQILKRLYTD